MEPTKLTEEEVTTLKDLQQRSGQIVQQLGAFELQRLNLESQRKTVEELFTQLRNEELELSQVLYQKYGDGNLNLETEEFTPAT
jgi:hypothetical protein